MSLSFRAIIAVSLLTLGGLFGPVPSEGKKKPVKPAWSSALPSPPFGVRDLFYFSRPSELAKNANDGRAWQAQCGFTGVILPQEPYDLDPLSFDATAEQLRAYWQPLVTRYRPLKIWAGLGSTRHLHDSQDNRETLFPWDDEARWARYLSRLRVFSRITGELGISGVTMDAEFYGLDYPRQDPKYAWRGGDPELIAHRGREYVQALRSGNPGVVVAMNAIHELEAPLAGYKPFWNAAFGEARKNGGRAVFLHGGTFGTRGEFDWKAWRQKWWDWYGAEPIPGWYPKYTFAHTWPERAETFRKPMKLAGGWWVFTNTEFFSHPYYVKHGQAEQLKTTLKRIVAP